MKTLNIYNKREKNSNAKTYFPVPEWERGKCRKGISCQAWGLLGFSVTDHGSFMQRKILKSLGRFLTQLIMLWIFERASDSDFCFRYLLNIDSKVSFIFATLLLASWSRMARRSMKIRIVLSLKIGMQQGISSLNISSFISSGNGMKFTIMLKGIPSIFSSLALKWDKISFHQSGPMGNWKK